MQEIMNYVSFLVGILNIISLSINIIRYIDEKRNTLRVGALSV